MSRFPTIKDVIEWLHNEEQPGMALTVETMRMNYERLREENQRTVDAYNELMNKHYPARREHGPVWTGD